jgi:hypothetical protein
MHHGRTGVAALLDAAAAKHNEGEYAGALAAFAEVGCRFLSQHKRFGGRVLQGVLYSSFQQQRAHATRSERGKETVKYSRCSNWLQCFVNTESVLLILLLLIART